MNRALIHAANGWFSTASREDTGQCGKSMAAPVKKRAVNVSSNFSGKNAKSESSDESSEGSALEENINQEV